MTALTEPREIERLLANLLGASVTVEKSDSPFDPTTRGFAAVYSDENSEVKMVWLVGIEAAASLGAALTGIPPAVVKEQVSAGALSGMVEENFDEVCNVMAMLHPRTEAVLTELIALPDGADKVDQWAQGAVARTDVEVTAGGGGPSPSAVIAL